MIFPISSNLSVSQSQLYNHLRTQSEVIRLYLSMPWSWVNSEYSIHWVQHTPCPSYTKYSIDWVQHMPSTAYTEHNIHWVLHMLYTALSQDRLQLAPRQSSIYWQTMMYTVLYIPTIISSPMNSISASVAYPSQTTASRLIVFKYSSNLTSSWPPGAWSNLHDHTLEVNL